MACPDPPGPRPDFIQAPNCAKVVMEYLIYSNRIQNVIWFQGPSPFDETALSNLFNTTLTAWLGNLRPLLPGSAVLSRMRLTSEHELDGPYYEHDVSTAGTLNEIAYKDTSTTLAFKFSTGLRGRSYRGRLYWPLLADTKVAANLVDATYAGDIRDGLVSFFDDIETALTDVHHVVVSYMNDCTWRTTAAVSLVTGIELVDLYTDVQRRRAGGRGI